MSDEQKKDSAEQAEEQRAKKESSRIDLSEAETMDAEADREGAEPMSVRQVMGSSGESEAAKKSQTSRIDLEQAEAENADEDWAAGKDTTVRVDLTGAMARMGVTETPKKTPEDATADADANDDPSSTARIALEGISQEPTAAEPPRTVRLKRPASAPRTIVLKKTASSEPPRTVVMKKPGASDDAEDPTAEKGATSRIQIPESAIEDSPATGRKTIRIKRSSGAGPAARTLTIARPSKTEAPTLSAKADAVRTSLQSDTTDEPGPLFGVLSLVALLVLCVLVYALLAQTVMPALPLPGRIG